MSMEVMKMIINITVPKKTSYLYVLFKTKKCFHLKHVSNIVEGDLKGYYIFIRRRSIQIQIINNNTETVNRVKKYLECIFEGGYLGISENYFDVLELEGVKKIRI